MATHVARGGALVKGLRYSVPHALLKLDRGRPLSQKGLIRCNLYLGKAFEERRVPVVVHWGK